MQIILKVALALSLLLSPLAYADGVNVQTFTKATGSTYEVTEPGFSDRGPLGTAIPNNELYLNLGYHFVDNPLVEYDRTTLERYAVPVDGIHSMQSAISYRQDKRSAHLFVPLHAVKKEGKGYLQALGDFRLAGKMEVLRSQDDSRAFSVLTEAILPTGDKNLFISNGSFGFGMRLSVEQDFKLLTAAVNFGFTAYSEARYRDIDYRRQFPFALGASMPVSRVVAMNAEFFQTFTIPRGQSQNPGELFLGAKWLSPWQGLVTGGLSVGQFDFTRSNDLRVHLGYQLRLGQLKN